MNIIYEECAIDELDTIVQGLSGTNRKLYKIHHLINDEELFSISLTQAYTIARLLNLDYMLTKFYENKI